MKRIQLVDADSFPMDGKPSIVIIKIAKKDIVALNIASAVERLLILSDSAEAFRLYRDSLLIQIDGYNGDKRELPEIPEVRHFFARLTQEWPYWVWFLARGAGQIALLMSLLCDVKIHRSPGRRGFGTEILDPSQLQSVFVDMIDRSSSTLEAYEIPIEDLESSIASAGREL